MDGEKQPNKVEVRDLNVHLICKLCGGYFVDACTLVNCVHSFCRGCILKHLQTNNRCPNCHYAIKTNGPNIYLREDYLLQSLVYKVLPNIYHEELQRRKEFNKTLGQSAPTFSANFGLGHEHFACEDTVSLSLQYYNDHPADEDSDGIDLMNQTIHRRYLQCPAAVNIRHLKKFVRMKHGLSNEHQVDVIYADECLKDDFTLMDVAYTFNWKRTAPMRFSYRIFQSSQCAARASTIASTLTASVESVSTELAAEPTSPFTPSADSSWGAAAEIDVQNNGGEGTSSESLEPPPKKQRTTADASIVQKQIGTEQPCKDTGKSKPGSTTESNEKRTSAKMPQSLAEKRAERVSSDASTSSKETQKASTSAATVDEKDAPKESNKKAKFADKIKGEEDDSALNVKAKGAKTKDAKTKEEKGRGGKKKGKHKHKRPVIVSPTILHNPDDLMKLKVKLNPVPRAAEAPGHHSRHHHHSKHHHTKHRKSSGSSTETSSSSTTAVTNKERLLQMRAVRRKTKKPARSEKSIEEIFQKQKASLLVPPSTITVSKVTGSGTAERRSVDGNGSQSVQADAKRPSLEIMLVSCKKPTPGSPTMAQALASGPGPATKNEEQKSEAGHGKAKDDKVPTGYGLAKSKDNKTTTGHLNHNKGKEGQSATGYYGYHSKGKESQTSTGYSNHNKSKDDKPGTGHNYNGNKTTSSYHGLAKGKDDKVTPDRNKSAKPVACYYSESKNGDSKLASASYSIAKKEPTRKRSGVTCYSPAKITKPLPGTIPFVHLFKNDNKSNKINMDNGLTITPKLSRDNQGSSTATARSKSPSFSISMKVKNLLCSSKSQEPRPPATSSPTFWSQSLSDKTAVGGAGVAATGNERRDNFGALDLSGRSSRKSESSSSGASTGRHSPTDIEMDIERQIARVTNGQKAKNKQTAPASQHTENGTLPATGMSNLKTLSDAAVRILMDAETKATSENNTAQTNGNKPNPNTNNNNNTNQLNNNNNTNNTNQLNNNNTSNNNTNNTNGHDTSNKNNNGVAFLSMHQQSTQNNAVMKMPSYNTGSALRIPVPNAPLLHPANRGVPRLNEIIPRGRGGLISKPVTNMGVRHIPNPSALFRQQSMNKHGPGQQVKPVTPPVVENRNGDDGVTSKTGAATTAATPEKTSEVVGALPVSSAPIKKIENMTRDIEKVAAGLTFRAVEAGLIK